MTNAATSFSRGWETFAHWLHMLKASLLRNLVAALILGIVVSVAWMAYMLGPSGRAVMPKYLACVTTPQAMQDIVPSATDVLPSSTGNSCRKMQAAVGGRPASFILKQALARWVISSCVLFVLLFYIIAVKGRRLTAGSVVRGGKLVDMTGVVKSNDVQKITSAITFGSLSALVVFALVLREKLHLVPDYLFTSTAKDLPFFRNLFTIGPNHKLAWFESSVDPGFYNIAEMHNQLAISMGGMSASGLFVKYMLFTISLSIVFFFAKKHLWQTKQNENITLAGVEIPRTVESYHWLFTGSPGSGKSTAIKELLDQVRARGERAIIYDVSGEYIENYYRDGIDSILNPLDKRHQPWSLWADCFSDHDFTTVARSLFPSGGKDTFWNDSAALVFAEAAKKLKRDKNATSAELFKLLTLTTMEELSEALDGTEASRFVDPNAGNMPSSVVATITSKLSSYKYLSEPTKGQKPFSVREFVTRDNASDPNSSWLFLSSRQDMHEVLKPLISMWSDLASVATLSKPPGDNRRVWIILDEVASLQKLPSLPGLLERGRKHGCAVVLGLQSMPQLREAYGNDQAAALASQPQTWLILRTVEPSTAKWLQDSIGIIEVEETRESLSMGADSHRDGVSISTQERTKPLVMASEIASLPDLTGYLKQPGASPVCRISYSWKDRAKLADGFVKKS